MHVTNLSRGNQHFSHRNKFNMPVKARIQEVVRPIVLLVKRHLYKEVLVLGDSHAEVFTNRKFRVSFPDHFFNVMAVGGATVSGLQNPNSRTQALPKFLDAIHNSQAEVTVVLLGEVDTGFVIWYRAEKYDVPVEEMLRTAIENYENLLMAISKKSSVICLSTPLPTILDEQDWGDIANERKNIQATQLERTELTLWFNKKMQEFCRANNFSYLSFDDESLGANGVVSIDLLNPDPNDHHYDNDKYAALIIDKLKECIEEAPPSSGQPNRRSSL